MSAGGLDVPSLTVSAIREGLLKKQFSAIGTGARGASVRRKRERVNQRVSHVLARTRAESGGQGG